MGSFSRGLKQKSWPQGADIELNALQRIIHLADIFFTGGIGQGNSVFLKEFAFLGDQVGMGGWDIDGLGEKSGGLLKGLRGVGKIGPCVGVKGFEGKGRLRAQAEVEVGVMELRQRLLIE